MKRLALLFCIFGTLVSNAQSYHGISEILSDSIRRVRYKQVVNEIFKEDELFVLFYLNLALVVDPTRDSQVVETITTENPWESLTKYLNGKSNIYFCPSGNQLNIAIEYKPCPLDKDILMSDRYGMYRLSSPEELFKNRGESFRQKKHKAVVFGGLKYDEMSVTQKDDLLAFRGKREAINGYGYLKSTYEEAIYIDSIFRKNGIETALLTGENGTEDSFAQIPSSHADILHIASHGEYNPDKDNPESSSLQEWMMSHSWLALSGADNDTDNGGNDGRLTAYEISQTDLTGVYLVVLSACDTGLGDVKENDVYGLLKGFKKAGAGTMLVSLSEVNDTMTGLMMKRFYDNLFRGDNPRRALENAQRYIRLLGKGQFNRPDYWEPFILVDDLDRNVGKDVSDIIKKEFLKTIVEADKIYSENSLFPNWKEIRKQLIESDAIVRICPYSKGKDCVDYVAMIGDAKDRHCHIVRLFSVINEKIGNYSIRKMWDIPLEYMDSVIWKPILPYIISKQKLYCHFSGIVQYYPYEALPSVYDDFQIYRMSSLNRLLEGRGVVYINKTPPIALFGDLDYGNDKSNHNHEGSPRQPLERGVIDTFPNLDGTKYEIFEIANILRYNKYKNVVLFNESDGNEFVLRNLLNNDSLGILHLATHAFAFDYTQSNIGISFKEKQSIIDYLFDCSGIALAGANESINDGYILELKENDNILSGSEIKNCDLTKLSLLVLSTFTPNTIDNSLTTVDSQRDIVKAFKMAGVRTILYSMRNIYDGVTAMLITTFYRNIAKGKDVLSALKLARQAIKEKGLNEPKYWAPFVLIDAIE